MHGRVRCCNSHHRNKSCVDLKKYSRLEIWWDEWILEHLHTSCLTFSRHWIKALGDLLQFNSMTLSMPDQDDFDEAVNVLIPRGKCVDGPVGCAQVFSQLYIMH